MYYVYTYMYISVSLLCAYRLFFALRQMFQQFMNIRKKPEEKCN